MVDVLGSLFSLFDCGECGFVFDCLDSILLCDQDCVLCLVVPPQVHGGWARVQAGCEVSSIVVALCVGGLSKLFMARGIQNSNIATPLFHQKAIRHAILGSL